MLEELAEAALFEAWLTHKQPVSGGGGGAGGAGGVAGGDGRAPLLLLGDAALLGADLQPAEYLGGVCDLVGEIGRWAVRRATDRDAPAVAEALESAVAVQTALLLLGSAAPRGLHKKGDALRAAVTKLQTLRYELSLVERSGRTRAEPAEPPPDHPAAGGGGGGADE